MPRASLKCPKCSRKFSMAAHLARHVNSIHKKGARAASKGKVGKKSVPTTRRAAISAGTGAADLLAGLETYHVDLLARREALDVELDALGQAISAMGGAASAGVSRGAGRTSTKKSSGGHAVRAGSLTDYVGKVLSATAKPIGPKEIAKRAVKMGYRSKAADLTKAVSNALPKIKGLKRIGFGLYTA